MTNNNQVNNLQTLKSQEYLTIYLNNNLTPFFINIVMKLTNNYKNDNP